MHMKAPLLVVVAVLGAALLVVPALGLGSGDGRKVLEARVLAGLPQEYTAPVAGAAGAIRGVNSAGAAWSIGDAEADLRSDGRLEIDVQGLIVTVRGNNPLAQFGAVVSCQTIVNGAPAVTNVSVPALFDATTAGDAETEQNVDLPTPCLAPIVFVTTPGGAWIATTGR
jgi:hypothetical protein